MIIIKMSEGDPDQGGASTQSDVLWDIHASLSDAFQKECNLRAPEFCSLKKDIKFHGDQCTILTNLTKQREAEESKEGWTTTSWNTWLRTATKAFEDWTQVMQELLKRLQGADLLKDELNILHDSLHKWVESQPSFQKVRAKFLSVPGEYTGVRAPVITPTPARTVSPSTGARSKVRTTSQTMPYTASGFSWLFDPLH